MTARQEDLDEGALLEPKTVEHSLVAEPRAPLSSILRVAVLAVVVAGFVPAVGGILGILTYTPYALVAAVLIFRMPRQPIGWLLLAIGWSYVLGSLTVPATTQQMADDTAPVYAWVIAWLAGGLGNLPVFELLFVLAVIFPSGRFPAGAWGRASRVLAVVGLGVTFLTLTAPTLTVSLTNAPDGADVANPLAIFPDAAFWGIAAPAVGILVGMIAAGAISLVVRLRRSSGIERQQLRWLVATIAFVVIGVISGLIGLLLAPDLGSTGLFWIPVIIGLPLIPISIGIAVLRYRLFEIDVLVNRTVLYGLATLVVAVAFGAANVVLQRLMESVAGQRSDFVSAAVGAGAAVAVGPLIRAIRPVVDRVLPSRATLALLFTDIVGSTEKIVAVGDEPWRQLLGRYRGAMRGELSRFGGHEVNTAGDSFFATFGTPSAAVDCAQAMRAAAHGLTLETRTGVHYGECELRGEQVSGLEVHAAARVMAEAGSGEIVVSAALR
ncbi:MAG: hypothetical protein JJE40_20355, partial [Vicinamibacteria bacterium]|nr:hypothetical protein [Vicinamibacteria bacterium]